MLVTRTGIKSLKSSNSSQIGSFTSELRALKCGENDVSKLTPVDPIFVNFQVTRTGIKSRTSLNFGHIGTLLTVTFPRDIMGKWCLQASTFIFIGSSSDWLITRTGIKSRMSSDSGPIGSVTLELRALERQNEILIYLHIQT